MEDTAGHGQEAVTTTTLEVQASLASPISVQNTSGVYSHNGTSPGEALDMHERSLTDSANECSGLQGETDNAIVSEENSDDVNNRIKTPIDLQSIENEWKPSSTHEMENSRISSCSDEKHHECATPPDNIDSEPTFSQDLLLGLPLDSLHSIASFLSLNDFCNFGLCSKDATKICREIFRRVRMHGFRCATEVVTAWTLDQHADAKELCALYISSGVPIYPISLGYSYHTMVWRMGIEAKEMQSVSENVGSRFANGQDGFNAIHEVNTMFTTRTPVDRFFLERNEHRAREGLNSEISYLEEKSIYLLNTEKHASEANSFGQSFLRQLLLSPHRFVLRQPTNDGNRLDNRTPFVPGDVARPEERSQHTFQLVAPIAPNFHQRVKKSESHSDLRNRGPKVRTETVLSKSILQDPSARFPSGDGFVPGDHLPPLNRLEPSQQNFDIDFLANELRDSVFDPIAEVIGHDLPPTNSDNDGGRLHHAVLNGAESIFEPPTVDLESASVARRARDSATVSLDPSVVHPNPTPTCPNILVNVDLEVYSASSADKKVDIEHAGERGIRTNLQARFAAYQRRLENLLALHDNHGFDECMLDFWDEFLPTTSSIHYHDRNTAVPRISCLHKFLTSPCPKAIGVVQCEIERIKVGPKKKGVNMKGRFFPTYEYRLFIHHQTPDMGYGTKPTRRDTVLMMAKNRGRKHVESSTASVPSKKGANNYYLYVPQQEDIEQHFKSVNAPDVDTTSITNGASNFPMPSDGPNLMGRLQSNFIGTEFQIFTQLAKKGQNMKDLQTRFHNTCLKPTTCPSEEDYGYDSAVSSDNPSSSGRHRGRFGRLSLRRSGGGIPLDQTTISEGDTHTTPLRRSRSSGDVNECNRRTRTSRRAIANSSERIDAQRPPSMQLEEEDGAITYTANLLGSRPRIMDVCIPKVSPDGTPGLEWRKYLERCLPDTEGGTRNRMLHHLKQIQQRMENEDHGLIRSNLGGSDPPDSETYSPPEDFGLLALQNRPPWWNIELGSFVLNFGGRVSVASVKNFQLCDRNDQDYIMLQFGRIQGRHSFTMDFQHPLTAVQAFAIAISSLQSKISFG